MERILARAAATATILALASGPANAARLRSGAENLLQVVLPVTRAVARAHPHVNVVLTFGTTDDGRLADPSTLRVRFGRDDITDAFEPVLTDGVQTGAHAVLDPARLRIGRRARNRLRLVVQTRRDGRGKPVRDIDRVRFGADDVPNEPPVALATAATDVAAPGIPIAFAAAGSRDSDGDRLTYTWDFGDGTTSSEPAPTHTFAPTQAAAVTVVLSVSDGQASASAPLRLPTAPDTDPGRTPGHLRIEADGPLEFGAIALGTSQERALRLRNLDPTATSQVKVRIAIDGPGAFTVTPAAVDLGPDGVATVRLRFQPDQPGHQSAGIGLVASAVNRSAVTYLAHGHGGAAPGTGPSLLATPLFAANLAGAALTAWLPDGTLTPLDAAVGTCSLTGDACLRDEDCETTGEQCTPTSQTVTPDAFCSDATSLFVLAEGTFTDPDPDADPGDSGTLLRFDLDTTAAVGGKEILGRVTDDTTQLACDAIPGGQGGQVYVAERHAVADSGNCFRDEREALLRVNKRSGSRQVVNGFARLDASAGVDACDLLDAVERLHITADGQRTFAGFESRGLWQIRPTARPFTPDVSDHFVLDPDGQVVIAVTRNRGATSTIELYRVSDRQVELGAVPLAALAPCASLAVQTNQAGIAGIRSVVTGPAITGGRDAVALVTFTGPPGGLPADVFPFGPVQGTVAFAVPSGTGTCTSLGLVNVQSRDLGR